MPALFATYPAIFRQVVKTGVVKFYDKSGKELSCLNT